MIRAIIESPYAGGLMAATTDEERRAEAIQVAAVCVQIIEAIDARQESVT